MDEILRHGDRPAAVSVRQHRGGLLPGTVDYADEAGAGDQSRTLTELDLVSRAVAEEWGTSAYLEWFRLYVPRVGPHAGRDAVIFSRAYYNGKPKSLIVDLAKDKFTMEHAKARQELAESQGFEYAWLFLNSMDNEDAVADAIAETLKRRKT